MKRIRGLQARLTPGAGGKWAWTAVSSLASGLAWAFLCHLVEEQSVTLTFVALLDSNAALWLTGLFLGLSVLALTLLLHSLFLGNLVTGAAAMILTFINYYKLLITSTPLTIGDFALAGQVGDIAALNRASLFLSHDSVLALAGAAVWLLAALFFSRPLRIRWRWSALGGLAAVLAFFLLFWVGVNQAVFAPLGAHASMRVSQSAANKSCGTLLGLWRGYYVQTRLGLGAEITEAQADRIVQRAEAYAAKLPAPEQREKKPNVILILSESFFDVTGLEGVSFETDPLPGFHALQEESISGTFYSRSLGYGTCNIELEVLTGMNSGLLWEEELYHMKPETFSFLPAVPDILRENGYYTGMLHMFNDSIYDRQTLFQHLGFEDMYFSPDFAQFYPPAAEAEDYQAYLDAHISGTFYSDDLMSDLLAALYEKKSAEHGGPLFLYASSIEGHQPYPEDKYGPDELTVDPISPLTGEAAGALRSYCQGAANASAALEKLADYFRGCGEPTVIVFYGDHRPGLGLSTKDSVYSQLGLAPKSISDGTAETYQELYSADYLIWSNDPAYLPGEPGSTRDTSCSYLGAWLLELTGCEMPLYWKVIDRLSQTRAADRLEFHVDREGQLSAMEPTLGPDAEGLFILRSILNDTFRGERLIAARLRDR